MATERKWKPNKGKPPKAENAYLRLACGYETEVTRKVASYRWTLTESDGDITHYALE